MTFKWIAIISMIMLLALLFHIKINRNASIQKKDMPFAVHPPKVQTKYLPIKDIVYHTSGYNSDRLVRVVPRRVYYDNRLAAGKPRNTVIMITEIHDSAMGSILACEVNGHLSKSFKMFEEETGWVRSVYPQFAHVAVVLQCKGLPHEVIFNGSIARIIYKMKGEDYYSRVESEHPMFLPSNSSTPSEGKGSIVVCTTMYGHPDKFDQWVMYHHYLGVERVHVQAHTSFSDNATHAYSFFNESLSNGFVRMDIWNPLLFNRSTFHNQMLKYQDCIYRHIGIFEYALLYDFDDFFNPIIPNQNDIHFYFSKFFSKKTAGTVCIPWHQMECGTIASRVKDVPHGNLTSILGSDKSDVRGEKKCAHRLSAPLMVSIHKVQTLISGYRRIDCPAELAYVAHNRFNIRPCAS